MRLEVLIPRLRPAPRVAFAAAAFAMLASFAGLPTASAHEYWLAPTRYQAEGGDTVSVGVLVGTGFRGEPKPYAAPRTLRFELIGPRAIDLTPVTLNGELTWARFVAADAGGALVAYSSNYADISLPAPQFDDYLRLEGLAGPLAARGKKGANAGPGRERYARSAKTWIAGTDAARAQRVVGLPLEIVPLADPATASPLPIRVLYHGQPLAGALVRAWNARLAAPWRRIESAARDSVGPAATIRTNAVGEAGLDVSHPGEWLLSCVHMVPSEDRAEADWQSQWASFTFARAAVHQP